MEEINEVTPQAQTPTELETKSEVKNPDAVLAKNRELLAKQAELKSQLAELENFKNQAEQARLEKEGNLGELVSSLREQLKKAQEDKTNIKKNYAYTSVKEQIQSLAKEAGCVRPDLLIGLAKEDRYKDYFNQIQVDDDFKVNIDDTKRVIDLMKDEFKDIGLFKPKDINHTPATLEKIKTTKKTLGDLTKEEIEEQLRQL